ncbi:hypothetical protein [Sphingosinicella sp. BN140058]|uniref:ECs_2282 family putative zinc-binding protein n=1 Tax=Sphingosinicella sp. BN140058 TaxID=1892855 RepID=UPI0010126CFC|nr:hypothetical protein [Sphingosinicella sp. BN140058]QAY75146.1 hypothetical protein ETR14_00325 [Sphingosinicella sp. BN140058]
MDSEKYSRSIKLLCPTCGHGTFEYDKEVEDGPICCNSCERVFTRAELIQENGEIIDSEVSEVKAEIVADITKDFRNSMRKAFSGSKNIKFR